MKTQPRIHSDTPQATGSTSSRKAGTGSAQSLRSHVDAPVANAPNRPMYRASSAMPSTPSTAGRWAKRTIRTYSQYIAPTDQPKPNAQPSRVARRTELPMPTW